MRKALKIIGLVCLNFIIIAGLLEIVVRVATPLLPQRLAEVALYVTTGTSYDQTWSPAWQRNGEHGYVLQPGLDEVLQYGSPSVNFRLSTIELWEGGGIGFRTRPVDYRVDAVVVGDSFGFCFTERADCWVNLLEQRTGWGMVNLSQPVTGTRSHYRILRDFGQPLTPPLVIWQFFGNDFNEDYGLAVDNDVIEALPDDLPPATALSGLHLWLTGNSAAFAVLETALTGRWAGLPQESILYDRPYQVTYGENIMQFGGLYEQYALDMARPLNQAGYDLSRQAFQEAQALVQTWDGEMVVVMIPTREEVYAHLTEPLMGEAALDKLRSARAAMHDLCAELDLRCLDPIKIFQERAQNDEALYHVDDMHLNAHGNAVLATWLAAELDFGAD